MDRESAKTFVIILGVIAIALITGVLLGRYSNQRSVDAMQAEVDRTKIIDRSLKIQLDRSGEQLNFIYKWNRGASVAIITSQEVTRRIGEINTTATDIIGQVQKLLDNPYDN